MNTRCPWCDREVDDIPKRAGVSEQEFEDGHQYDVTCSCGVQVYATACIDESGTLEFDISFEDGE